MRTDCVVVAPPLLNEVLGLAQGVENLAVYLAYSALLMAGLDGIANRIHPGEPAERDLFDPDHPGHGDIKQVVTSLHRALDALEEDQEFLTKGDVFSEDFIASYIALKREEQEAFEATP